MFYNCKKFNQNLSKWDMRNVEYLAGMFYNCHQFNKDITEWKLLKN
ncbi:MAG: BspA family leucine-rich repeat surface protein [Candidatus Thiodubiliella endoseptemdiera]|uniref:BspA family leucine-rich repeat surface protein n=1 Tax=Candidatus Thiodubiliella endoseptemdiera TaxID=2738886 RepID=A0A853F6B0_9GAMM|nr:BspA family leucine-rich repeat surface protein [Candidatus Thiodubiliella endoseptemdiera]